MGILTDDADVVIDQDEVGIVHKQFFGKPLPTGQIIARDGEMGPQAEILGPGLTSEVAVEVRNFGPASRAGVRVALSIDGVRQPSQKIDLGARSAAQAVFPVVFERPGFHALEAELEGDRLAVDDRRAALVYVPAPLAVLLVRPQGLFGERIIERI